MYELIYAGNGAASQFFSETVKDTDIHVTDGDLDFGFRVSLTYASRPAQCTLILGFWHRNAELQGYYLARQESGQLLWQTIAGFWSRRKGLPKRLFKPGDDVADLLSESSRLVAVAVWKRYKKPKDSAGFYPAVLYLGNGADGECYSDLFRRKHLKGVRMRNKMGSRRMAVLQKLPKKKEAQRAFNCFSHTDGSFMGFYARKRTDAGWLWYTDAGAWCPAVSPADSRHLFLEGDAISCLFEDGEQEVVLEAQWQAKDDGRRIACGYPMYSNRLMAHGLGGYGGKSHCNCLAGFEQAMANGYQYFETDIHSTSDGRIVLYHGWFAPEDVKGMSYDELMAHGNDGQPLMDARQLYPILRAHPGYTLELDLYNFKGETIKKRIRALISDFAYDRTVLDRLLVQVHSVQMMKDIDAVYPFKHYQILASKDLSRLSGIITNCLDNGICAIGMRMNLAKKKYVDRIKAAGLYAMCFTVSRDTSVARHLFGYGVDTLCTDYITSEDLKTAKDLFGRHPFYVYYNSGVAGAGETYSQAVNEGALQGTVAVNDSGTLEFRDKTIWQNDGERSILDCRFTVPGKRFAGWNVRIKIDEKQLWLATDGCYHNTGDFGKKKLPLEKRLFLPGEKLPVWTMQKGIKYIMSAVWEDEA